jgi:poly(3-hydroxybutyrate) depolymerase
MERPCQLRLRYYARRWFVGLMCVFALVSLGLAKTTAKPKKETLTFGGKSRIYYVFAPSGLTAPAPAILLLHGSGHDGMSLIDPWKGLAQKAGIILVAPNSINQAVWDQRADGPDFLLTVLADVESKNPVDKRRVYLFGHSGGAMYALYLSIVGSEYFAATAVHAGALLESNFKLLSSAKRKTPISIWVGTADASLPLAQVKATKEAFEGQGFPVELHVISFHNHSYYAVAGEVNAAAWQFLKTNKLEKEPDLHAPSPQQYPPAAPGSKSVSDPVLSQAADLSVWAGAKPYMDDSLQELTAKIHELRGLEPAIDQHMLPDLLQKTADKSVDLLRRMPNVISHESVVTEVEPQGPTWRQQFEYLVLRRDENGEVTLDEYRTNKGKTSRSPLSQGSVNAWVLFHPGNLAESRFRYLGRQQMDGHTAVVIAFAQIPDKVKFPAQVSLQGTSLPVMLQGVAWIDESDFRIVRLHTDLLTLRPDIYLKTLTTEVRFWEVRVWVQGVRTSLWLPQEAKITWDFNGQTVQQQHKYSTFRLYSSKTKLIM